MKLLIQTYVHFTTYSSFSPICFASCKSRDKLTSKESEFIRKSKCVNKIIPNRTREEYWEDNQEDLRLKAIDYYNTNREDIHIPKSREVICEYGSSISKHNSAKQKSQKHIDLISVMNDGLGVYNPKITQMWELRNKMGQLLLLSTAGNQEWQGQPVALGGSSVCEASNMNRYKTILKGEK